MTSQKQLLGLQGSFILVVMETVIAEARSPQSSLGNLQSYHIMSYVQWLHIDIHIHTLGIRSSMQKIITLKWTVLKSSLDSLLLHKRIQNTIRMGHNSFFKFFSLHKKNLVSWIVWLLEKSSKVIMLKSRSISHW